MKPCVVHVNSERYTDGRCKTCVADQQRTWQAKHPEKAKKARKAWKDSNPEKVAALKKAWNEANPDYARRWNLQRFYGITLEQYNEMLESQKGRCAVCHVLPSTQVRAFAVDHDHSTGRVRGILCQNCNWILGKAKDDPNLLVALANYLRST